MSPPPRREVNAKVEGRDLPKKPKETLAAFKVLTRRLLNVPMGEVKEQQTLYEAVQIKRRTRSDTEKKLKVKSIYPPSEAPQGGHKPVSDNNKGSVAIAMVSCLR